MAGGDKATAGSGRVTQVLRFALIALLAFSATQTEARAQPAKVIIDTDIGDDIDDAFALALVLASPEVEVLGITTAWGDTARRARLVDRFLSETGHCDVPVAVGVPTKTGQTFTQGNWANVSKIREHPPAVDFLLQQIRAHPGEITLIAIAPLTNLAAAIDRDPQTFGKLKQIIAMGGSIYRGYGDLGFGGSKGPDAEYNIKSDIASAQHVLKAGVKLTLMPLDSTEIRLEDPSRGRLLAHNQPLAQLYAEWRQKNFWKQTTPILFDAVPVAAMIDRALCAGKPMSIAIDDHGFTRQADSGTDMSVCLQSDAIKIVDLMVSRLSKPRAAACNP